MEKPLPTAPDGDAATPPPADAARDQSTVGTGSVFAIGCVVIAMVVIFAGIALFFVL